MQGLGSWNQFLKISNYVKTCFTSFPGAQSASLSTLHYPKRVLKVSSCSSIRFNLCRGRRQMPLLLFSCWQILLESANLWLTTCWLVISLGMAFLLHSYTNIISNGLMTTYGGAMWYIPLELGSQNIEAFCGSFGLPSWLRWSRIRLQCRRPGFYPGVGKIHWRREWLPNPVFLPGECHGQRSLAGLGLQRVRPDWEGSNWINGNNINSKVW